MAKVGVGGTFLVPPDHAGVISTDYISLDAAAEKIGWVFIAPRSETLIGCRWRTFAVTTSAVIRIGLQGVNSSGDPDGTWLGATNNAYITRATIASNTLYTETFTESQALTAGTRYAIVIKNDNESNPTAVVRICTDVNPGSALGIRVNQQLTNYVDNYVSSWTKRAYVFPALTLIWSGSTIYEMPDMLPVYYAISVNAIFNTNSNPDEVGNKIVVPFNCRVIGLAAHCGGVANAYDLVLYNDADTVLGSVSVGASSFVNSTGKAICQFASPVTIAAGTTVRAIVKPTTTSNVSAFTIGAVADAADMAQLPMGTNCVKTSRQDAGAWTDSTTDRAFISLVVDQVEETGGTAGGFGYTHPGMDGGIRG